MERTKQEIIKEYLDGELSYIDAIMELEELGYSSKAAEAILIVYLLMKNGM